MKNSNAFDRFFHYLKTRAKAKVTEGTMLLNAKEKVEDVYSSPIRKKYCTKLVLQIYKRSRSKINNSKLICKHLL